MAFRVVVVLACVIASVVRPAGAQMRPEAQAMKALAPEIRTNLEQAVVGFWYPRSIDAAHGGYILAFDDAGAPAGSPHKMIVSQARMVWFFARLARSGHRAPEMKAAAAQGFRFLRDRMWDADHGGFYWEVDAAGTRVTDPAKSLYGQSFGLYALSEYHRATGDEQALALATRLFDLIVRHGRDPVHGGYFEQCTRAWDRPPEGTKSHIGGPADAKLMNTHLHLLEAFAEYYRASGRAEARERLHELITIETNAVVRKRLTACTDQYRRDWTPILEGRGARVSYGHDLENIWLVADAVETVGQSNGPLVDLYRRLFAYSRRYGFDRVRGGVYSTGRFRRRADEREKVWWVQAETLVSALTMYRLTGAKEYAGAFERTWRWVQTRQTDWKGGDWHNEVRPDGTPTGPKASQWKEAYHQGRALILCLEMIESLEP
jgi:mannobiose 2-epimerase